MSDVVNRTVVLLSGGLDSTVAAAVAKSEGFELYALTIDYGQRHAREIEAARSVAKALKVREHHVVKIQLNIPGSALTDTTVEIPKNRDVGSGGIPVTYVPVRNLVFLSIGVSHAEAIGAHHVYIGVNAIDYSGYPDCRPEFVDSFQKTSELASKAGAEGKRIEIRAPLINMKKSEIVELGKKLGAPLELTWSCYEGGERACGTCDSCLLRKKGFEDAGMEDTVEYNNT
jgi:7-cyano-7-deazaguanine synthase